MSVIFVVMTSDDQAPDSVFEQIEPAVDRLLCLQTRCPGAHILHYSKDIPGGKMRSTTTADWGKR